MPKKIAIFHNFMDNIGGAEIVDLILARELEADIYTTNIDREKIAKMGFSTDNIYSIGKIPANAPWRQEFAYWKFRQLKLGHRYDFYIIAGDWALGGAIHNQPNFWYVFSPIREIFDLYGHTRKHSASLWQKPFFDFWAFYRRYIIKHDVKKIKNIVSISQNTSNRVQKYFNHDSRIIYPPVETKDFYYRKNGDFWLSVNRLINYKRVEIQIEAFRQMPDKKLIIVGSYEPANHFKKYVKKITGSLPANVKILNWVDREKLIDLYADCCGFITTSIDEDFGLTAVEALASGKAVIAPNEGGYRETLINNLTGIMIDDIDPKKLISAIQTIEKCPEKYRQPCQNQAQKFDTKIFIDNIKQVICRYGD